MPTRHPQYNRSAQAGGGALGSELLVARQERTGYAAPMSYRRRPAIALRSSHITRAVMLLFGALSVPSMGPAAMQPPHCTQHGPSATHQKGHSGDGQQVPAPRSASWDGSTNHDCPHCPATECARVAPCTTSSNAAVSTTSLEVSQSVTHRATLGTGRHHLYSIIHQPPTPPPQLIS